MSIIQQAIDSCDERFMKIGSKLIDCNIYYKMMELTNSENKRIHQKEYFHNCLKLVKVEKMIYNAMLKSDHDIFKLYLAKYDEFVGDSFEIAKKMVACGSAREEDYLQYCKETLKQRDYIRTLCESGFI